jgi:hypothetical protein
MGNMVEASLGDLVKLGTKIFRFLEGDYEVIESLNLPRTIIPNPRKARLSIPRIARFGNL